MKDGDRVVVDFVNGYKTERGILCDHTKDWSSVVIVTERGGKMVGGVRSLKADIDSLMPTYEGGGDG